KRTSRPAREPVGARCRKEWASPSAYPLPIARPRPAPFLRIIVSLVATWIPDACCCIRNLRLFRARHVRHELGADGGTCCRYAAGRELRERHACRNELGGRLSATARGCLRGALPPPRLARHLRTYRRSGTAASASRRARSARSRAQAQS